MLPGEAIEAGVATRLTTLASESGVVTAIESRALIPGDFVPAETGVSSENPNF